jgi:guanine deaminase
MPNVSVTALRGTLATLTDDPFLVDPATAFLHEPDALIVCRDSVIEAVGPYGSVWNSLPADTPITDYSHPRALHAKRDIAGQAAPQWVSNYIYAVEEGFADETHARAVAAFFCDALLRNGMTTACV